MKAPVHIISIGQGNISSVANAIEQLGGRAIQVTEKGQLDNAERLVLPGIGHFGTAMHQLSELGLDKAIIDFANSGRPVLGICLGMQLLATSSEEGTGATGLGLFNATVRKMSVTDTFRYKIPHNGWNTLELTGTCDLLKGISAEDAFFFLHGYAWNSADNSEVAAQTTYESSFPSVIGHEKTWGVQFHPEKSHEAGLRILTNFLKL